MSSNRNKLNFLRQTSLTYDSPKISSRRNSLNKQNSEDPSTHKNNFLNNDIKITVNAKRKTQPNDFPRPKIAWDDEDESEVIQQPIIARKCPESRKPTRSLKRQSSVDQDSILSCKEDIISKLRLLLKDEPEIPEKPNLSIFLNQNPQHEENKRQMFEDRQTKQIGKEEKLGAEGPTVKYNSECTTTSLFQFRKNPVKRIEEKKYTTDRRDSLKEAPNILVSPVSEIIMEDVQNNETKTTITDNSQPINNIIIRPTTAKSRRELFSKRTNSAFHSVLGKEGNNQRPTLQRSSSAPIRPEQAKSKFLATKRRLKSGKKKDAKTAKRWGEDQTDSASMECLDISTPTSKNGAEIITMVSLVSPASSDVEEILEINEEETKVKSRSCSPKKTPSLPKKDETVQKISSLRKVVKQVSFQQSSIHAIRSFSAGFPGRKNSMATSMMLGGSLKRANSVQKKQEKRFTNPVASDDDERVPKRRLVRSRSAHVEIECPDDEENKAASALQDDLLEASNNDIGVKIPEDIKELKIADSIDNLKRANDCVTDLEKKTNEEKLTNTESQDGQLFFTSKEKECWKLYQKMSDKGVKVNYDTLLRGMLTPTEYRTRRQSLAASASLAEDTNESADNEVLAT